MEPTITVAWIAAGASSVAAVLAGMSARRAQMSAAKVNSVNHQVAAIDREIDELREAWNSFLRSTADAVDQSEGNTIMMLAETLGRCLGADEVLRREASNLAFEMAGKGISNLVPLGIRLTNIGQAYQDCQHRLADRRLKLLAT